MTPVHEDLDPVVAGQESGPRRFEHLYEISKLFTNFESVEQTLDRALAITAKTLPLRSVMLVERGRPRMIVWTAEGRTCAQMQEGAKHMLAAYRDLGGVEPADLIELTEQAGNTTLPAERGLQASAPSRFIVTPLVTPRRGLFGVLQMEGTEALGELDLIFINAIASQLSVALDRHRAWRSDIARREDAEEGRIHAEQRGASAEHERVIAVVGRSDAEARGATSEQARVVAENSSDRYEALARENARLLREAQHAVHVREQILAVVSHDLRNPLGTILLTAATLEAKGIAVEAGQRIQRGAERMLRLIEDLLDFASIEAGRLAFKGEPQDPGSLIRETLASFESIAREKGLHLSSDLARALPHAHCDRDRILQVLSNLVGNATKICAAGGRVTLRVEPRGKELLFAVADDGPGIRAEDLEHLFERYWRAGEAEYKGTGLGLAIASGIVSAHGGRIWAESELGRGATFFFTVLAAGPATATAG